MDGRWIFLRAAPARRSVRGRPRRHPVPTGRLVVVRALYGPAGVRMVGDPRGADRLGDRPGPPATGGLAAHGPLPRLADHATEDLDRQSRDLGGGGDVGRDRVP